MPFLKPLRPKSCNSGRASLEGAGQADQTPLPCPAAFPKSQHPITRTAIDRGKVKEYTDRSRQYMENEYMKRGYLLPDGCKDLIDLQKYRANPIPIHLPLLPSASPFFVSASALTPTPQATLPPITAELTVSDQMTVRQLAAALNQEHFRIIADLMEIGVFAAVDHPLAFDAITKVARKYGYAAKKAV